MNILIRRLACVDSQKALVSVPKLRVRNVNSFPVFPHQLKQVKMRKCVYDCRAHAFGAGHPGYSEWLLALLPHESFEICCNPVEMFRVSRYARGLLRKARGEISPENLFCSAQFQSRARQREICGILGNKCGNLQTG